MTWVPWQQYITNLLEQIHMQQTELAAALQDVKAQLLKASGEITAHVAALEEAMANAGQVIPAVEEALTGLRSIAQALDDLNPDATP